VSRAFLICPEPVRQLTAGVGSRFLMLARVLVAAGHRVTLAVPNDPAEAGLAEPGLELTRVEPERIGAQAGGHDWVLLHAHLGNFYLSQRDDLPVVVDLYDPFLVENMHYNRDLGLAPYRTDHATWRLQMARGDFFLCSSEEQRLYYLGWLSALGRVNPLSLADDPDLRSLIDELPFGTPEEPPRGVPPRAEVLPGVAEGALVLYFGGIYDWYDAEVVLAALPAVLERAPRTVVVFVEHPHPELTPLAAAARARAEAERRGWLGNCVRFEAWRPFERRFELPQVCDLAVVTHRPGLETELSLRTRLVDLLWLGLPAVVTAGGTMARVIAEADAGRVVPPADPRALAEAVLGLAGDPAARERAARGARTWAAGRSWSRVAAPLLEFARAPWRDTNRAHCADLAAGEVEIEEPLLRKIQRALRRERGGR